MITGTIGALMVVVCSLESCPKGARPTIVYGQVNWGNPPDAVGTMPG